MRFVYQTQSSDFLFRFKDLKYKRILKYKANTKRQANTRLFSNKGQFIYKNVQNKILRIFQSECWCLLPF